MQGRKRKACEGYGIDTKCENTAEFLVQIPGKQAWFVQINMVTPCDEAVLCCAGIASQGTATKYIVIDHVERIADAEVLAVLLKTKELTGGALQCDHVASKSGQLHRCTSNLRLHLQGPILD